MTLATAEKSSRPYPAAVAAVRAWRAEAAAAQWDTGLAP